jgi:Co/Zn/Cd efflux system component
MLADAMVYGMALGVVGGALARQVRMAHLAAVLQALLAVGVLLDVLRRVWWGSAPMPELMMGMATLAMIANGVCLLVLARHRQDGAHMRATWIFTSTDALANAGVVVAGALVAWSGSEYPDLVMGAVIAIMVFQSARLIWRTAEAGSQTGR